MGEKGRSQLQRDMRESIYATIAGATSFFGNKNTSPAGLQNQPSRATKPVQQG